MKYFEIQELVPKAAYQARGDRSITVIDNRIITFIDNLRGALSEDIDRPITVNNWNTGGNREWSTLRTSDSPWFSQYSQHSFGRAIDFKVSGMTAKEVRAWIITNRNIEWIKPMTFMEGGDSVTWVHIDCRCNTNGDLYLWNKDTGETKIYKR